MDGTIGSQIVPFDSANPALAASRVNMFGASQDHYYAHLSRVDVHAGQHVTRGQQLELSGSANGSPHAGLPRAHAHACSRPNEANQSSPSCGKAEQATPPPIARTLSQ